MTQAATGVGIDLETETILTLSEACKSVPPRGISINTINRWWLTGVRGARLETMLRGGRRITSREALARFFAAQNPTNCTPEMTESQLASQNAAAKASLQAAGVI